VTHKYALPEPPPVADMPEDGTVIEVARVWIGPKTPTVLVRPIYDDPKAMGMVLAQLCWNFAHAYETQGGFTHAQALEALKEGFGIGLANGEAAEKQRAAQ
jgi:hypothetical protein